MQASGGEREISWFFSTPLPNFPSTCFCRCTEFTCLICYWWVCTVRVINTVSFPVITEEITIVILIYLNIHPITGHFL